jgi:hypothetical protein
MTKNCEIIKRCKQGERVPYLADTFGIGQQTVWDIIKNQDKIENFVSDCETFARVSQRKLMKGETNEQLDSVMVKWFLQQRTEGTPISGPMILNKAKYFFKKLDIPGTFQFSSGWLKQFKERHGIRELQIQCEQLSADNVGATLFCDKLAEIIEEKCLVPTQIYNADETGLYW